MDARKVFLDIGAHIGESVGRFFTQVKNPDSWYIYCFEPLVESWEILRKNVAGFPRVRCYCKAITGGDTPLRDFWVGTKNDAEGSTLRPDKTTGDLISRPVKVVAETLGSFLICNLRPDDKVALKLNIEGGEYEVMQYILEHDFVAKFTHIFIQLHTEKLNPRGLADRQKLEQDFRRACLERGVKLFYADKHVSDFSPLNYPNPKGKSMKVAHFAEFGPSRSGLYGTTRDLVMAERSVGLDAVFIDTWVTKDQKIVSRPNLSDGDLPIVRPEWAHDADILVHHSIIHHELRDREIPIVLALHGRPESTFLLEHRNVVKGIYGAQLEHGQDPRYKAFFTFWKEHLFHHALMLPKDKLHLVPAPVDLGRFTPNGKAHKFKGSPAILIADMWRHDVTPFNVVMGAVRFANKYAPDARIHIIGAIPKKRSWQTLTKVLRKAGCLGSIIPKVANPEVCYRGADMVVCPHAIATRVVRESLACGTPVVAHIGNPYANKTADTKDPESLAQAMERCWQWMQRCEQDLITKATRTVAVQEFHPEKAGLAAKKIYDIVLSETTKASDAGWFEQGALSRKKYPNYQAYLDEQKSKLPGIRPRDLRRYDKEYGQELRNRLSPLSARYLHDSGYRLSLPGTALCLGARQGTEVRIFQELGWFAVGIDVNPGPNNRYVVMGDFHKLPYPDGSVDVVFTNSMDHVYRPRKFCEGIKRVLKPHGIFLCEVHKPRERSKLARKGVCSSDRWASLWWKEYKDLVAVIEECGLKLADDTEVKDSKCDVDRFLKFFKPGGTI
jgi:FkbM family methyltransferase